MRTLVFFIFVALSCYHCHAQLKMENSTSKQKNENLYDVSEDLYVREDGVSVIGTADLKFYQKFVGQRIFCISNKAFSCEYAVKRQFINLSTPIMAEIEYKKKRLSFQINQIATYLYHPKIQFPGTSSSGVKVIDDLRGNDITLSCYEKNDKTYSLLLLNALNQIYGIQNEVFHAGHSYLIKKVLTAAEASTLFEESTELFPKMKDRQGSVYFETSVAGKTFLTQSIQNDVFIQPLQHEKYGGNENEVIFAGNNNFESPIFLLEDENGELILVRLNEEKRSHGNISEEPYVSYIIENHIAFLKEQYRGGIYRIKSYPDNDKIVKIEDIVIRDNLLSIKYVDIKTKDVGYQPMEWSRYHNTDKDCTSWRWEISHAEKYEP